MDKLARPDRTDTVARPDLTGTVGRPELVELGYPRPGPCLSVFMPAESAGTQVHQDEVRLKHLFKKGEALLAARGIPSADARRVTSSAETLVADAGLWGRKGGSIAVFLAPDYFKGFRVPLALQESVVVAPRLITRSLLPLLAREQPFFLLMLSRGQAALLRVAGDDVHPVQVPRMPPSLRDATQLDDQQQFLTSHASGSSPSGAGGQMHHGHGSARDARATATTAFLREVDAAVAAHLRQARLPVVLAAADEVASQFRRIATTPLLKEGVAGGEHANRSSLAGLARGVVARASEQEEREALARFGEMVGRGRVARHLEAALQAAHAGRVQELFVAEDAEAWGAFDPAAGRATVMSASDGQSDDLLDLAATLTLREGGRVYPLPASRVPGDVATPAAAVLRDKK